MTYEEAVAFNDRVKAVRRALRPGAITCWASEDHRPDFYWCSVCEGQVDGFDHDCIGGVISLEELERLEKLAKEWNI